MKRLLAILTFCTTTASAQSAEDSVRATINGLFEGMRKADTAAIRFAFAPGAQLQTVLLNRDGITRIVTGPVDSFLAAVARPHSEVWDERVTFDGVKTDGPLASAWAPYRFFAGGNFSHCGIDAFNLARINGAWKIIYLVDPRRRTGCE